MLNNKEEKLEFLKTKIQEIKLAKFSVEMNSLLRLPNNIITTSRVDSQGNIWFFTSCNGAYARNIENSFYASLEYYKKGNGCRLNIAGRATIIEDKKEMQLSDNSNVAHDIILIKLEIQKAEYFANKKIFAISLKETFNNIFAELFFSDKHREFDFLETIPNDFISTNYVDQDYQLVAASS